MRIAALAFLALAACSEEAPGDPLPAGSVIDCALAGSTEFTPDCTMERANRDGKELLIVRHPDGGFHRLLVTHDGRGVVAADGAESARVTPIGTTEIEVAIGGSRYRLPATVGKKKP